MIKGLCFVLLWACEPQAPQPVADAEARFLDSLLQQMTVEEKIGQLTMYNGTWEMTGPVPENDDAQVRANNIKQGKVGAMLNVLTREAIFQAQQMAVEESRLGIPMLFGYDVIHGYQTMLPIPLAQASSWEAEVGRRANRLAAAEAATEGISLAFGPMVDITRDARWGRIMEGAGEDPYLASVMASAWVRGFQEDNLSKPFSIAACAKHFAAYGFAEAGKEYNTTEMSEQTLRNVVLPPFQAAVEAGVASVMNGFNELNGVPVTADARLQRSILKEQWQFDGFVVSDFNSVPELVTHGYSPDHREAAAAAFQAGSDLEMESRTYERYLQTLLDEGRVSTDMLDDAVLRVLRIKYRLGLFKDPYKYCSPDKPILPDVSLRLSEARDIARRSMVLLKNDGLLPLKKQQKVAVIGWLAGSKDVPLGNWRAQAIPNSAVSLLEGIRAVSEKEVKYAEGYRISEGERTFIYDLQWAPASQAGFAEALQLAREAEVVVMALGEDCYQTGEGRSQTDLRLKGNQQELFEAIRKVNPNIVVVLMNGRPLAIPELAAEAPAILEAWHGGSAAGDAIADILYGVYNPSGKLPVSFPYHSGQEPLYYNHKPTGRPVTNDFDKGMVFWAHYSDAPAEALYPFGYGLSYSKFKYTNLELIQEEGKAQWTAQVRLTNEGEVAGEEVLQWYLRDLFGSMTRPVKELLAFEKIYLAPGEQRVVRLQITEEDLAYHWPDGRFEAEPGEFTLMVGGNSEELLSTSFTLQKH